MLKQNKRNYTRQRTYCVKLLRKEKKNVFDTLIQKTSLTTNPFVKL